MIQITTTTKRYPKKRPNEYIGTMKGTSVLQLFGTLLLTVTSRRAHAFVVPRHLSVPSRSSSSALELAPPESVVDLMASVQQQIMVATATEYPASPEPIHTAFQIGTNFGQPFFLLMIFFPKASITKKIMGGLGES